MHVNFFVLYHCIRGEIHQLRGRLLSRLASSSTTNRRCPRVQSLLQIRGTRRSDSNYAQMTCHPYVDTFQVRARSRARRPHRVVPPHCTPNLGLERLPALRTFDPHASLALVPFLLLRYLGSYLRWTATNSAVSLLMCGAFRWYRHVTYLIAAVVSFNLHFQQIPLFRWKPLKREEIKKTN